MIRFICGSESRKKTDSVVSHIRKSCESGRRVCMIVPEQQAVVWETRLAELLPAESALVLDVVSFTRLANLIKRKYGRLTFNPAGKSERALVMWKAISSVVPLLRVYGGEKNSARTVSIMQSAVTRFKRSGVSAEKISNASEALEGEDKGLSDRLFDISLVMSAYEGLFGDELCDPEDEPSQLLEILREHRFFENYDVYVDSFYSLTAVEEKIVREIIRQASNFTMTFVCKSSKDRSPDMGPIVKFYNSVRSFASGMGEVVTEDSEADETSVRELLSERLWDFSAEPIDRGDYVSFIRCEDVFDEAQATVCRVEKLIREGARYSDIAVICRSGASRMGILDATFADHNIPLSVSQRYRLANSPLIRLVTSLLECVRSSFGRREICNAVSTGLTSLTPDEASAFERYTQVRRISGYGMFADGEAWTMNPEGFAGRISPRGDMELRLANSAKQKIADALLPLYELFSDNRRSPNSVCKVSTVLAELWRTLEKLGAYEKLRERCISLDRAGYRDRASFGMQSWKKLTQAFDTFHKVCHDMKIGISEFCELFSLIISCEDVGTIPCGIDEVVFGEADRIRLDNISHVIILGAVEGEFPKSIDDSDIFSDIEMMRLEGEGIVLSDNSAERSDFELFRFRHCITLGEKSLCMVIPDKTDGKRVGMSVGARRIYELFPNSPTLYFDPENPYHALWNEKNAPVFAVCSKDASVRKTVICAADRLGITLPATRGDVSWDRVSAETAEALFGKTVKTTQSKLETYKLCAFMYYGKYILGFDERDEIYLSPVDVGSFVHKILERYFTEVEVSSLPLTDDENAVLVKRLISEYITEVLGTNRTKRIDYQFKRLEKSVLLYIKIMNEEFAQSDFRTFAIEQSINSESSSVPPFVIKGRDGIRTEIGGVIDRLDLMRRDGVSYVKVIDYKTGSKKLDDSGLAIGLNTQLFLYLFSVWKCPPCEFRARLMGDTQKILPAGAMYFSARPGSISAKSDPGENVYKLCAASVDKSGKFLADEDILRAQDKNLSGSFIPVKITKDKLNTKNLLTEEEFDEFLSQISETVSEITWDMCSGDADAVPLDHKGDIACDFCKMKAVCRNTKGRTKTK